MKFKRIALFALTLIATASTANPIWAMQGIVVSIKPIHSLVAAVSKGVSEPFLILQQQSSPHSYSLRPSEAKKLKNAKIIFWIGKELEQFLVKPVRTLGTKAKIVTLSNSKGLTRHEFRKASHFNPGKTRSKKHDHHHHGHAHGKIDQHFWLDPVNAIIFTQRIEATLRAADPSNAQTYALNAKQRRMNLRDLVRRTGTRLKALQKAQFFVFHDAYQYFEKRFGLSAAGAIIFHPDIPPSAKRVSAIQKNIKNIGRVCVFSEPQFNPKTARLVTRGTDARLATLDPLGATIPPGPELYGQLINNIANSVENCLSYALRN